LHLVPHGKRARRLATGALGTGEEEERLRVVGAVVGPVRAPAPGALVGGLEALPADEASALHRLRASPRSCPAALGFGLVRAATVEGVQASLFTSYV
jgi:hypothetical protein